MIQRHPGRSVSSPNLAPGLRRGIAALLAITALFATSGCGGSAPARSDAPRHLTVDRPNAPFAEPAAIQGIPPLAKVTAAKASAGGSSGAAKKAATRIPGAEPSVVANLPSPEATKASFVESPTAPEGEVQIVGQIVRGERARGAVIAEVDVERCFQAIPSYRSMKGDRNSRDYARYLLTITAANEEFRSAVEGVAIRDGFDVVVEKGGVRGARTVDITDAVCERLAEQKVSLSR